MNTVSPALAHSLRLPLAVVAVCIGLGMAATSSAATATISFDAAVPFTDYPSYEEQGFALSVNVGQVSVNNAFSPYSNAAQPSFGFGQGFDSRFSLTTTSGMPFGISSIDLLEADSFPEAYGLLATGYKEDSSFVTQVFTLDGIAGSQTFAFSADFSQITRLQLSKNPLDSFFTEAVQIDNLVVSSVPEPAAWVLAALGLLLLGATRAGRNREWEK